MLYQVHVPPFQKDYTKFVLWPNGDQELQVSVHLFGGIHSPNAANYALKRTASDYEHLNRSDAVETLRHNFYVIYLNHAQQRKLLFSCCRPFFGLEDFAHFNNGMVLQFQFLMGQERKANRP